MSKLASAFMSKHVSIQIQTFLKGLSSLEPQARSDGLEHYGPKAIPYILDAIGKKRVTPAQAKEAIRNSYSRYPSKQQENAARPVIQKLGPKALPPLIRLLKNQDAEIVTWALKMVAFLGKEAAPASSEIIRATRYGDKTPSLNFVCEILAGIGKAAIPALVNGFRDDRDQREHCAYVLAQIGEPAIPALIKALANKRSEVRIGAIDALRAMNEKAEAAVPELIIAASRDEKDWNRAMAVYGLQTFAHKPEVAAAFVKATEDKNNLVSYHAISGLLIAAKTNEKMIPAVIALFNSKREFDRESVERHVVGYGEKAVKYIFAALDHDEISYANAKKMIAGIRVALSKSFRKGVVKFRLRKINRTLEAWERNNARTAAPSHFARLALRSGAC